MTSVGARKSFNLGKSVFLLLVHDSYSEIILNHYGHIELIAEFTSHKLAEEVWIANFPTLFYLYLLGEGDFVWIS